MCVVMSHEPRKCGRGSRAPDGGRRAVACREGAYRIYREPAQPAHVQVLAKFDPAFCDAATLGPGPFCWRRDHCRSLTHVLQAQFPMP